MACTETVQFFQFDAEGNMYVYPAGSGCTGTSKLVHPGDEMIFDGVGETTFSTQVSSSDLCASSCQPETSQFTSDLNESAVSSQRSFHDPLKEEDLEELCHKNFAPETLKKVKWAVKLYREWRTYRCSSSGLESIECDLDDKTSITKLGLIFALVHFLSEIKKMDGSEYPGKTLYDILICIQFHLETYGFTWKLLNDECFKDIRFTLDNLMKLRVSQGIGISVKQAQILTVTDEDLVWNIGLLGLHCPESLLNTVVFVIGKGFSLRAGKEHYALRRPPYNSQFVFHHDQTGQVFLRYTEDIGLKINKGGIKHRKIEPKQVDLYPIDNVDRCPLRVILMYLSKLPKSGTCQSFYMQPRKKYTAQSWSQNRPAGQNRLRDCIKDVY